MKHKFLTFLAAVILVISIPVATNAAQVYVNGQHLNTITAIEKGTLLVPLREIFESLGAKVDWNNANKTVTAQKNGLDLKLRIGSKIAYRNGKTIALDVPGKISKGNTFVPLRFVSEALGAVVDWNATTKTVLIGLGNTATNKQSNSYLDFDQRFSANNTSEIFSYIKDAYLSHSIHLKLKVNKNDYSDQAIHQVVEKVNEGHSDSNYYISQYFIQSKGYTFASTLDLDLNFEYQEVISGLKPSDSSDTILINSNSDFYNAAKNGIENTQEKIPYKINNKNLNYDINSLMTILNQVALENPGSYVSSYEINSYGLGGYITIRYAFPVDKVKEMKVAADAKAKEIVQALIKPDMTDLEKEKALHDYLVLNTKYDEINFINNTVPKESYTAYGALINGVAVCEGYATALDKLLKLVGIESKVITGTAGGGAHAWNMAKIDGNWYYVDATWDDPVPDRSGEVSHAYFNLSEQEIRKDHNF